MNLLMVINLSQKKMKSFLKEDRGMMSIEMALIIPIMLFLVLMLVTFVRITIAEIALKEAVSEAAKTSAHFSYVVDMLQTQFDTFRDKGIDAVVDEAGRQANPLQQHDEIMNRLTSLISNYASESDLIPKGSDFTNLLSEPVYDGLVTSVYKDGVGNSSFFNPDGVEIIDSKAPGGDNKDVLIEAQVKFTQPLPFYTLEVTVNKKAVERGWVGG